MAKSIAKTKATVKVENQFLKFNNMYLCLEYHVTLYEKKTQDLRFDDIIRNNSILVRQCIEKGRLQSVDILYLHFNVNILKHALFLWIIT